jgi:thiamine pyrophosphate-dependent acetolactate synthase large subunit-like protein
MSETTGDRGLRRDVPVPGTADGGVWGSDAIALMLRALDVPYVCLNPGASFRGLHDSLVNTLGNERPQMLLCLHEEHAIAIAHGYAKVTGRPLAAIVHSNVGLMHASMAMFNAWCDRLPVIVLGATGPVDAARRRPWIDWIHTMRDQGALVRSFVKWDDQPASVPAAYESLLRARQIAQTAPKGPVYVCFDVSLQEDRLSAMPPLPDPQRFLPPPPVHAAPTLIAQAAAWLREAKRPLLLMGRVSRAAGEWNARVALAEALDARVLTDLKVGAAFPTDHPLHAAPPGVFLSPVAAATVKEADVVLALDWVDVAGTLRQAWGAEPVTSRVIQVSADQHVHHGAGMEYQGLAPADLYLLCEAAPAVHDLLQALRPADGRAIPASAARAAVGGDGARSKHEGSGDKSAAKPAQRTAISIADVAAALQEALAGTDVSLTHLPLGWSGEMWHFRHPLDFLGADGGGGIGAGPGLTVGAAIALKGTGRVPVGILGDGDYLMGASALWTAANARVPLLIVVCNNRSFYNDEIHQERVAKTRDRPVENKWIGQRIDDPAPDLAMLARAQGLAGVGPVKDAAALPGVLVDAVARVQRGEAVVVDVHVAPGYSPSMAAGVSRGHARASSPRPASAERERRK